MWYAQWRQDWLISVRLIGGEGSESQTQVEGTVPRKRVYIETSIVSYLTAWPSRDLVKAARQEITLEWWERRSPDFELYTSELALEEAADGNDAAAGKRVAVLRGIRLLRLTQEVGMLAHALIAGGALPRKAVGDAAHIAVAAVHGMDFLLTWNCRHLANSELIEGVSGLLLSRGYKSPVVCTPETLMGE